MAPTREAPAGPPELPGEGARPPEGTEPQPPGTAPAGLGRRLAALVIDWFCCVLLASAFTDPRGSYWPLGLLIGVNTLFIGLFGQTPGMAVARLRCVSYVDGGALGPARALVRAILLVLIIPAVVLDGQRRGLHDKAAGSIVVSAGAPAGRRP